MTEIQNFNFNENDIRIITKDENSWFVAKDICEVLDITNVSQAVSSLDEDEKLIYVLDISGQNRN